MQGTRPSIRRCHGPRDKNDVKTACNTRITLPSRADYRRYVRPCGLSCRWR